VQTVRHFFPPFNHWLDRLPDTRVQDACTYPTRFMAWHGILLYLLQPGSRRQIDYELDPAAPHLLPNLNRLAETALDTRPVHGTLDHFLGHVPLSGWETLNDRMVQRLVRSKVLDPARLLGQPVLILDATGLVCFHRRHCEHCLVQRHGKKTLYMHQVLEAKLLGPAGIVVSLASEFIDNADVAGDRGRNAEEVKQDCELKALHRLLPRIKERYPQLPFVLALDSLYGCGPVLALAKKYDWSFVITFKRGRTPALWQEYEALRAACPENYLRREWADGPAQEFRWVRQLDYEDSEGRRWKFNALECTETTAATATTAEKVQYFAWMTGLPVGVKTVEMIAQRGGRDRWKIENEGFNRQKNSGLNLEHVYSIDPEKGKAYYILLQIAFLLIQLTERGSLLSRLLSAWDGKVQKAFGSLQNIARRLAEGLRWQEWPAAWFDADTAARLRISFDNTS
jgi:hypothetical protein